MLLCLCACAGAHAEPAPVAQFNRGMSRLNVSPMLEWYLDASETMPFEAARARAEAGEFQRNRGAFLGLGPRKAAVWCRFTVENRANARQFVLELNNPRMPKVEFYVPAPNDGFKVKHAGTAYPFDKREIQFVMPSAKAVIPPESTRTFYVRVRNTGEMRLQLWLWEESAFFNHAMTAYTTELVMVGALLMLALFHTVIFISIRERGYLYLAVFLYACLLLYLAFTATGSILLWPNAGLLADRSPTLLVFLVCGTFMVLANTLLEAHRYTPGLARVATAFAGVCLLGVLYSLATDSIFRIYAALFMAIATGVLATVMGIWAARRGAPSAIRFLVSWCVLYFGGMTLVTARAYALDPTGFGTQWMGSMLLLAALAWFFELTARVKGRVREQQRLLEVKVAERTRELREALDKVKTLSGLLPICSSCKNIRDDQGYWSSVEVYLKDRSDAVFTHSICPDCRERLYPGLAAQDSNARGEHRRGEEQ